MNSLLYWNTCGLRSFAGFAILVAVGCTEPSNRKPTYPVSGQVVVDGQPAENLAVRAHQIEGFDAENPTYASAFTDAEGRFVLSTYEAGDGIPEGKYSLTFMWGKINPLSMAYGGPDRLKGRYTDPQKSEVVIDVGPDSEIDLGRIELTTR